MTQYNSLNVKLSNSQLNKLKFPIKNETGVVLRLPLNMVGDDGTNFPHKLSLTNKQVKSLRKSFVSKSSTDLKLSKTQLSKMVQSGEFLSRLFGSLLKIGLPLIKNVIKPLAKSVLISFGLTVAASAADAGIHKKILGSDQRHFSSSSPHKRSKQNNTTILIITNGEMKDIIEIVNSLEDSGLLLKRASETIQNESEEQKAGFLSMLLGTLGASLLGNILAGKGINRAGEGIVRAGYGNKNNKMDF